VETANAALARRQRFRVKGGARLAGEVRVTGAKNSVLKLMAAALLAPGVTTLSEVPDILDVAIMSELLRRLGCDVQRDRAAAIVTIDVPEKIQHRADYDLVRRMRASIAVLGPLLARTGEADVALPGGDAIGSRPLDFHIAGLLKLGATVENEHGFIVAKAKRLTGATIWLDFPSVGATENLIMAATLAKGTTTLDNAAREPEIVDLCRFLVGMGAQIEGIGSTTVVIHGVPAGDLHGVDHRVVPDRVEAATYLAAVGLAGGEITVREARAEDMEVLLRKLRAMGLEITPELDGLRASGPPRLHSTDVATLPYPGVATDYKPLITAMLSVADGVGIVTENLFAGRFRYVDELIHMGADIRTDNHHAVVRGVPRLVGTSVVASDIRAGAALVVAALAADGETVIDGVHHVDRGYEDLVGKLRVLGADIVRHDDQP
jgi:UDP-N-acetylglucosamine 1-carboxyvinyltransferase